MLTESGGGGRLFWCDMTSDDHAIVSCLKSFHGVTISIYSSPFLIVSSSVVIVIHYSLGSILSMELVYDHYFTLIIFNIILPSFIIILHYFLGIDYLLYD